jgi:hypothetical protein
MRSHVLAVTIVLALGLAGCADPTSPGGGGAIDHPTGADEPILKITASGGFVPMEYLYTALPQLALYGDGTLVIPGAQIEIYPGPAMPAVMARTVSEDGIQAILRAALDAGLDRDGDYSDLGRMGIADASTTVFELTVDGQTHRVTAYALGLEGEQQAGQPGDVWEMRRSLQRFAERVGDLASLVPEGSLGAEHPHDAAAAQLLVRAYQPDDQLPQEPIEWPLATSLEGFGDPADMLGDGTRCGVVGGDDWAALRPLADRANQLTPWTDADERFAVTFRPLLPDEPGCVPPV